MDEEAIQRALGGDAADLDEGRIYRVGDSFRGLEFQVPWEQLEAGTEWAPGDVQGSYVVVAADGAGGDGKTDDDGKTDGKTEGDGKTDGKTDGKPDGKTDGKPDDGGDGKGVS